MLPARPAEVQTPSSARERIVYPSSPAIRVAAGGVSPPSRPVTLHKLGREGGSKFERRERMSRREGSVMHLALCALLALTCNHGLPHVNYANIRIRHSLSLTSNSPLIQSPTRTARLYHARLVSTMLPRLETCKRPTTSPIPLSSTHLPPFMLCRYRRLWRRGRRCLGPSLAQARLSIPCVLIVLDHPRSKKSNPTFSLSFPSHVELELPLFR